MNFVIKYNEFSYVNPLLLIIVPNGASFARGTGRSSSSLAIGEYTHRGCTFIIVSPVSVSTVAVVVAVALYNSGEREIRGELPTRSDDRLVLSDDFDFTFAFSEELCGGHFMAISP